MRAKLLLIRKVYMYIQKIRLLTDINLEAKPKRCFRILVY